MNVLRKDDYILITDKFDNRYLKIGKIIEVEHDGTNTKFTVIFGYDKNTNTDDVSVYDRNLPEKCRIMDFR